MTDFPEPKFHDLKTWRHAFQAVWDRKKTFEFRKDDRGFAVGDVLILKEWDPSHGRQPWADGPLRADYTGREVTVEVTFVLRGEFGVPEGYAVLSFRETGREE